MDPMIHQTLHHLLCNLADEVVEVSKQERAKTKPISMHPSRLMLPLLQAHSIAPVSTLHPSSYSNIVQPRVLKQKKNSSCGYYALYNVLTAANALTAQTEEEALQYVHQMRDRTRFWVTYNNIKDHLHKKASSSPDNKYPWTRDHIDKGILERPYIQYLMNSKLIPSNVDITVLSDFSIMGMKHSILELDDLHKLAQVFATYKPTSGKPTNQEEKREEKPENDGADEKSEDDELKSVGKNVVATSSGSEYKPSDKPTKEDQKQEENREEKREERPENDVADEKSENDDDMLKGDGRMLVEATRSGSGTQTNKVHAFLVGQACHWISFICVKVGDQVEVLVFDSRNHNLLTSPHEEFVRIVNKAKKKIPEWKKEIYLCSLREPKMTADLFHDCVMGIRDIITSFLEHNMEGFLSSFEEHVEKAEMQDVWLVPLMTWLEMYWPPPVVESNIIKVLKALGVSKLSAKTREKFLRMVKLIRESINFKECDIPVVQRFEAVVLWFEVAFSVPLKA